MANALQLSEVDWLYPDLLSKEGLVFVLKQRYIKHTQEALESQDKEQLVELYNRYILPLPQRKYRNNRNGRALTKKQIMLARKRKITESSNESDSQQPVRKKGMMESPSGGLVNQFSVFNSTGSRLKPPPSCINFEKKVVKLSASRSSAKDDIVKDVSKNVVKLKVSKHPLDTAYQEVSDGQNCISQLDSTNDTAQDDTSLQTSPSPPKKKFAKITWP